MTTNENIKTFVEKRSGEERRTSKNPRRKENRSEAGKPPRRTNKDRRKTE